MANQDGAHIDRKRELYPIGANCYAPAGTDRDLYRDRIQQDSARLFSESSGGFELLWTSESGQTDPQPHGWPYEANSTYNNLGEDLNRRCVESAELDRVGLAAVR